VVIDVPALAEGLGIPVVAISAKRNEGIGDLFDRLARPRNLSGKLSARGA
jgi:Fe2+ transport system protein B